MKVKRWEKIYHANSNEKRAGVAILISEKIDLRQKLLLETKEDIL